MIARLYWEQLNNPTSLGLAIAARYGDWATVLNHTVKPASYLRAEDYAGAAFAVGFLKKNPFVQGCDASQRRSRAVVKWWEGEKCCYKTNERLARYLVSPDDRRDPLAVFLSLARSRLLRYTGRSISDDDLKRFARFGPGSTFASSVPAPNGADKYFEVPSLTRGCVWLLPNAFGTLWSNEWAKIAESRGSWYNVTQGNRFVTVPKTALIDRAIAIEASLNVYFQLAVGRVLRDRLRRNSWRLNGVKWDLDSAADVHRKVARMSSLDDSFATLDLSNASDTLCKNLVRILLHGTPLLTLLEDLRSPKTFIDGKWVLLEKFSSMGNGYTFELETLCFIAICEAAMLSCGFPAVLGKDLFVFGDDIIVPAQAAQAVRSALEVCGFELNGDKSFITGPFKESCGEDYYDGKPVRPFYSKTQGDRVDHLFGIHNGVRLRWRDSGPFLDQVYNQIPFQFRCYGGPARAGDSVLHGRPSRVKWEGGIKWVRAVVWEKPQRISWGHYPEMVRLACRLTGHGDIDGISYRGGSWACHLSWVSDS